MQCPSNTVTTIKDGAQMKKIFLHVLLGSLLFAGITGCTADKKNNTQPNSVTQTQSDGNQNQTDANQNQIDEAKIRNIAFQWVKNREDKIKEWEAAQVIETKYTDDHKVYKGDEIINIQGMDTYKVVFEMEDEVWGSNTISVYVDKESKNVLGADLIAR